MSEITTKTLICDGCSMKQETETNIFYLLRPPYNKNKHICFSCKFRFISFIEDIFNGVVNVDEANKVIEFTIGDF